MAESWLGVGFAERGDQVAGGLVAFAADAETAVDDFLEVIAAREAADVLAVHRAFDVTLEQHGRDESDLIDVVPLLPAADLPPGDLRRRVEDVERVRGDAAAAELVRRDAEVAELELLILADEDVEWREVAVQCLPSMQRVERL